MTMRLSIIALAGIARTLVAVGTSSEADMFLTTAAAAPRITWVSSPSVTEDDADGLLLAGACAGLSDFSAVFSGAFSGVLVGDFAVAPSGLSVLSDFSVLSALAGAGLSALAGAAEPPLLLEGFGAGAGSGGEVGVRAGLPLPLGAASAGSGE
jgi:hypothetical protein